MVYLYEQYLQSAINEEIKWMAVQLVESSLSSFRVKQRGFLQDIV